MFSMTPVEEPAREDTAFTIRRTEGFPLVEGMADEDMRYDVTFLPGHPKLAQTIVGLNIHQTTAIATAFVVDRAKLAQAFAAAM